MVDLPEPEGPTMAVVYPGLNTHENFLSTYKSSEKKEEEQTTTPKKRDYKVCLFDLRPQNFLGQRHKAKKNCLKPEKQKQKKLISKSRKRPQNSFEKVRTCPKKEPRWFEGRLLHPIFCIHSTYQTSL